MPAKTSTLTNDGFTIVARKVPVNNRSSSLYHHIDSNIKTAFKDVESRKIIKWIKAPTKKCLAYLLLLEPNANNTDLSAYFPEDIVSKYKNLSFTERHIRIDKKFRAANSYGVVFDLKSHWHYTETYGDQVTVHLYFDYGLCVGVFIKVKDTAAVAGSNELQAAAMRNAEDAIRIVSAEIQAVAVTKKHLREKFEKAITQLQISNLANLTPEKREALFTSCHNINEKLKLYNEDIVDKRFDMLSKLMQETPANVFEEEEEEQLSAKSSPEVQQTATISKTLPSKAKPQPKPEISIKSTADLLAEYRLLLSETINKKDFNLDELINIHKKIRALKEELLIAFCNLKPNTNFSKTCETIELGLTRLPIPSLLSKFEFYANMGKTEETKRLFDLVHAEIPASFYSQFIFKIMKAKLTPEEQTNVNTLCDFFYRTSDDYRLFMSHLADITNGMKDATGEFVGYSPFATLYSGDNFETFKLLLEQSASRNPKGYLAGDRTASLITILSLFSFSPRANEYLQFLLDKRVKIEDNNHFASGALCNSPLLKDSKQLGKFIKDSKPTNPIAKANFSSIQDHISGINLLPYFGAAIVAYVNADYQSPTILKQLAERSSIIHTLRAFAIYCTSHTINRVVLEQERFGIQFVETKDIMYNITKTSSDASITKERQVRYIGTILRPADNTTEIVTENIKILYEVVQQKLLTLSQKQINDIVINLQQSAQTYERNFQLQLCIPCHQAIIMLLTRLAPSIATHRLILHTFSKLAGLFDLAKQQDKIFNVAACEVQTEQYCDNATLLGYYSVFHETLMKDPAYAKAESAFNEFQRSNMSQYEAQERQSRRLTLSGQM